MKYNNRTVGCFAALVLGLIVTSSTNAGWVSGFYVYPYKYLTHDSYYSRPFAANQKSLVIQDLVIQNTPVKPTADTR